MIKRCRLIGGYLELESSNGNLEEQDPFERIFGDCQKVRFRGKGGRDEKKDREMYYSLWVLSI